MAKHQAMTNYTVKQRQLPNKPPVGPLDQATIDALDAWFDDLVTWGRKVREDIKALEQYCEVPWADYGDPGDPPPKPWG